MENCSAYSGCGGSENKDEKKDEQENYMGD